MANVYQQGYSYLVDTGTPATGSFVINNSSWTSATTISIHDVPFDSFGSGSGGVIITGSSDVEFSEYYSSLGAGSVIFATYSGSSWSWNVTDVTDNTGYHTFTVSNLTGPSGEVTTGQRPVSFYIQPAGANATISNNVNNRITTATGTVGELNAEANLTFDGNLLNIKGNLTASGSVILGDQAGDTTIISGRLQAANIGTGTDNSVLIQDASGNIKTDEIDSRVWGSTLVDASNGANNRIATFTDSNSLNGETNLVWDGDKLGVGTSSPNILAHFKSGSDAQVLIESDNDDNIAGLLFKTEDIDSFSRVKGGIFFDNTSADSWGRGKLILATNNIASNSNVSTSDAAITINANGSLIFDNIPAGTDDTVLIIDSSGNVKSDEIDSRVWGSTLVDASNGANNRIAIFTDSNSVEGTDAVQWDGNEFNIQGVLIAQEKQFDIPHPTKEGWRLAHSVLEGPERGVYVRGKISGSNTIELPDYWSGLVYEDSISVQLTPVGSPCTHYIDTITTSSITIGCGCGEVNAHYIVHAERKAEEPILVEYQVK